MTNTAFAVASPAARTTRRSEFGRMRVAVLGILGAMGIASVTGAGIQLDRAASRGALPVSEPAFASEENESSGHGDSAISRKTLNEINALADLVARKYRVAPEATQGLVATTYQEGLRIGVDPLLILAVIAVESRFNPIARSDAGAIGLMQIIPAYHKEHLEAIRGVSLLEPTANIRLGARVLKDYIRRGGNEAAGLQLYNGSSDDTTNAYATKVLGEKQRLRQTLLRRGT